jgi:hypothetical protein
MRVLQWQPRFRDMTERRANFTARLRRWLWLTLAAPSLLLGATTSLPDKPSRAEDFRAARGSSVAVFASPKVNPVLLFLGTYHSFEPSDPQHAEIERLFKKFSPTLVMIEGGDWPVAGSREAAITRYAEMGWTRLLAARAGVQALSFEPSMADEIAAVLQEFPAEDVKLYYTLRWVPQFNITDPDDLDVLVERELRRLGRYHGLNVPPRTLEELAKLAQRRLNIRDWRSLGYEWTDPVTQRHPTAMSFLNEVAAASARVRDASLQQQARAAVARGERVLVIAGRAHWIESTPRLDFEQSHR